MLSAGIVGLPNVGKSTLFNAVTRTHKAPAENYPFCTIDPNLGVVIVPDPRLEKIAPISHSQKITPTAIEFVDIAGLVKGASAGEGLGNQFLQHIREVEELWTVVRNVADALLVLAVIAAGVLVMASGTFSSRYTAKLLVPRAAMAAVIANALLNLDAAVMTRHHWCNVFYNACLKFRSGGGS